MFELAGGPIGVVRTLESVRLDPREEEPESSPPKRCGPPWPSSFGRWSEDGLRSEWTATVLSSVL